MKTFNTETFNEACANYLEMQKTSLGWYDSEENLKLPNTNDNTFDILLFNEDWNWIMAVVEKIGNFHPNNYVTEFSIFSTKEEIVQAIWEFLNWYNENKVD